MANAPAALEREKEGFHCTKALGGGKKKTKPPLPIQSDTKCKQMQKKMLREEF
jgi:hypothetical protein